MIVQKIVQNKNTVVQAVQNCEHRRQWRQGWRPIIGSWTSWRTASASPGRPRSAGPSPVGSKYKKTFVDCRIFMRQAVLRIHDILVWIRILIWIRGSMPLTNGSGSGVDPDPAIFVIDLQDANQKQICLKKFFCLLLFEGTFTSFFKDKMSQKKSQSSRNQDFSCYFCLVIEGSGAGFGSIPLTTGSGARSRRPKTYGSGFGSGSATLEASFKKGVLDASFCLMLDSSFYLLDRRSSDPSGKN
jgi:hypothetical protein